MKIPSPSNIRNLKKENGICKGHKKRKKKKKQNLPNLFKVSDLGFGAGGAEVGWEGMNFILTRVLPIIF